VLDVQKPVQDIYTGALSISFVMLTVFGGVQAVRVLEQTGLLHVAASPVSIAGDAIDMLPEDRFAADEMPVKECELVTHRASQGNVYLDGYPYLVAESENASGVKTRHAAAEEAPDAMGNLYYALYTCSGSDIIAGGYI
jgi:hypothetical protein